MLSEEAILSEKIYTVHSYILILFLVHMVHVRINNAVRFSIDKQNIKINAYMVILFPVHDENSS